MSAVIDESVPVRLVRALAGIGCRVHRFPSPWRGLPDYEVLDRMRRSGRSCLVTCDRNLAYQQNVAISGIGLVVLPRQRFVDLAPYLSEIAEAAARVQPGSIIAIAERQQQAGH